MSENMNKKMSDEFLDAAAGEALGANSAADSAAYHQQLASAGPEARRTDLGLRRTVALLSATSPYLEPSEDLRGRILQATAPVTFRMEDYRKANRETGRFFKWGFYAAMLFLAAGAWYNLSLKSTLQATVDGANQRIATLSRTVEARNIAIKSLVNPSAQQIRLLASTRLSGWASADEATHTAVVMLPQGVMPPGGGLQLKLPGPDGKPVEYNTIAVDVPQDTFPDANREQLKEALNVQEMQSAPSKVYTAKMR